MGNWITEKQRKFDEIVAYLKEVEAQRDSALSALRDASVGLVDHSCAKSNWEYDTKLKYTAAKCLENIAKMPRRERPPMWW